jgi:hypothetical protein
VEEALKIAENDLTRATEILLTGVDPGPEG